MRLTLITERTDEPIKARDNFMSHDYQPFIQNESQQELIKSTEHIIKQFAERRARTDEEGSFPFENLQNLKDAGFLSLTVPKEYGGRGFNLYDMLLFQERLAEGDGATALSIGWHLGSILEMGETRFWKESQFEKLSREIADKQILINRAATELGTGSPTRGGLPSTNAVKKAGKWILNGRKSFTSMAVALDYTLVSARIGDTAEVGVFLVDNRSKGVRVEDKWNTISMRGTRSDDIIFENVELPNEALVENNKTAKNPLPKAWLLHIPACYSGIALAARNYAIEFAKTYHPNSLPGPISEVPEVQRKIGEMELKLLQSRQFLYATADKWIRFPEKRSFMAGELGAVKHVTTNAANEVVDLAMRIVGARSLAKSNPLQQFYRDVRAGLHNPPMDDAVISLLAKQVLKETE